MANSNSSVFSCSPSTIRRIKSSVLTSIAMALLFAGLPNAVQAQIKYDPEDPVVQEMIKKGLTYIENNPSNLLGPRIMYGMAAYKAGIITSPTPKEHPLIDLALLKITEKCTEAGLDGGADFKTMYAGALACIFLLELDAEKYEDEIYVLLDHIYQRQQDSGAWGYREHPRAGDTSQMQYIALALWLADLKGFEVDIDVSKSALQWMIDSQQQGGGWIYHWPPGNSDAISEKARTVRPSLVAAGLGTVYLYADLLKLVKRRKGMLPTKRDEYDLPPSVVDITNEKNPEEDISGPRISFDTGSMYQTMTSGNRWFDQNFSPETEHYNLYYLYGYERYAALREFVEGTNKGVEDWYDQGVEFLREIQTSNGSMTRGGGEIPDPVQTAFAVLFLTRSMQITINSKSSSLLNGGSGLKPGRILKMRGDRIVEGKVERSIGDLLELLNNPEQDEIQLYKESLDSMVMDGDDSSKSQQLAKLRGLVTNENPDLRLIAIKFLSKQRSMDNVPALIFALSDPDPEVIKAANTGLQFVSRRTNSPNVSEEPGKSEVSLLIRYWTEWYHRIEPNGILMDMPSGN